MGEVIALNVKVLRLRLDMTLSRVWGTLGAFESGNYQPTEHRRVQKFVSKDKLLGFMITDVTPSTQQQDCDQVGALLGADAAEALKELYQKAVDAGWDNPVLADHSLRDEQTGGFRGTIQVMCNIRGK